MYATIQLICVCPIPTPWDVPGVRIVKSTIVVTPLSCVFVRQGTCMHILFGSWRTGWMVRQANGDSPRKLGFSNHPHPPPYPVLYLVYTYICLRGFVN